MPKTRVSSEKRAGLFEARDASASPELPSHSVRSAKPGNSLGNVGVAVAAGPAGRSRGLVPCQLQAVASSYRGSPPSRRPSVWAPVHCPLHQVAIAVEGVVVPIICSLGMVRRKSRSNPIGWIPFRASNSAFGLRVPLAAGRRRFRCRGQAIQYQVCDA